MTEKDIREILKKECLAYRTNFNGLDTLIKMRDNYCMSDYEDRYDFTGCPQFYNVFEDAPELCEEEHRPMDLIEECEECWKLAFKWVVEGRKSYEVIDNV